MGRARKMESISKNQLTRILSQQGSCVAVRHTDRLWGVRERIRFAVPHSTPTLVIGTVGVGVRGTPSSRKPPFLLVYSKSFNDSKHRPRPGRPFTFHDHGLSLRPWTTRVYTRLKRWYTSRPVASCTCFTPGTGRSGRCLGAVLLPENRFVTSCPHLSPCGHYTSPHPPPTRRRGWRVHPTTAACHLRLASPAARPVPHTAPHPLLLIHYSTTSPQQSMLSPTAAAGAAAESSARPRISARARSSAGSWRLAQASSDS